MVKSPTIKEFVEQVERTDRRPETEKLRIAVLGVFGELGSLMSEIKKGAREGPSYVSFRNTLIEEAGDLLWYFGALAKTLDWQLEELFSAALGATFSADSSFAELENALVNLPSEAGDPWLRAGEQAGLLASHIAGNSRGDGTDLFDLSVSALHAALMAFRSESMGLDEPIRHNIDKSLSRFPVSRKHLQLYDDRGGPDGKPIRGDERLPAFLPVEFREILIGTKKVVVQSAFTIKIGDPLTDNIDEKDDYKFHDVFHLAYAAVLGWSPVLRALLKVKRKSHPSLDENQDGARAILIEEGISTFIFNHAKPHFFEGATGVDYRLLATIKEFVKGYEVEDQPFWAWEKAILRGYDVFRELTDQRQGRVTLDIGSRDIYFESLDT